VKLSGPSITMNEKIPVIVGAVVTFLVIIDLLMTRRILSYNNTSELLMFILTIFIGYGVGSWILLGYTKRVSKEVRSKSKFINSMYWTVVIIQFSLLAVLLLVLFSNSTGFLSPLVFAVSSILATVTMVAISVKFFSWYKLSNNKNLTILLYGIAAVTLAMSIAEDAGTKLLMIHVVQEKSPPGAITKSSFVYKQSKKYDAEIEYKVVNPQTTTLYLLPNSSLALYDHLNSIVLPIAFVFRWLASTTLLRSVYQRIRKLPLSLWIMLSLPLVLYLVGILRQSLDFEDLLGIDEPYRFYFRLLFRLGGTVGGNILFGLAFFVVARSVNSLKLRDYLIIAAIGDTIVGIALSTSALQQTYGVAAHSLVLLSSFMFSMGLYLSAISVSQDSSLRKLIRTSATNLIYNIGSAQMEKEIENRVRKVIQNQQKELEQQTGGFSYEVSEYDMKEYIQQVIQERNSSTVLIREKSVGTVQKPASITDRPSISSTATSAAAEKEKTHNTTIDDLVTRLRSAGAIVHTSTVNRPDSSKVPEDMKMEVLKVNGENVLVFQYKDDAAFADILAKKSMLDGSFEYKNDVTTSRSHTYRATNLAARYSGDNLQIIYLLESILGKETSRSAMASNKDMETEAARLAKENGTQN
jgi:hypothetical protein